MLVIVSLYEYFHGIPAIVWHFDVTVDYIYFNIQKLHAKTTSPVF